MADPQITFRLDADLREAVAGLVEQKKYPTQTEFIVQAVREKLEREGVDEQSRIATIILDKLREDEEFRESVARALRGL